MLHLKRTLMISQIMHFKLFHKNEIEYSLATFASHVFTNMTFRFEIIVPELRKKNKNRSVVVHQELYLDGQNM